MAQGNGYFHLRASHEEGLKAAPQDESYMRMPANVTIERPRHPRSKCGTYVPGITGKHPLLKEEMINLPNPLVIVPWLDGERLDMDACHISEYLRSLDLASGLLTRRFIWTGEKGVALECAYERFTSMMHRHLLVQRAEYRACGDAMLTVFCGIDEKVRTNGYDHFEAVEKTASEKEVNLRVVTDNGDEVWMKSRAAANVGEWSVEDGAQTVRVQLAVGQTLVLEKYTSIITSRDQDGVKTGIDEEALPAYGTLLAEQKTAWAALWERAKITIEGDDQAQSTVDFSVYHLLRCASETDDRVAVCAKGFAGEAYFGHFFWDTEMYLLPFYLYLFPERAMNLARFRIRTLPGAQRNAAAYGYPGARYPWESSVTGEEQCPNWQYADHEVHVTADVVFGLWHTYCATQDEAFLREAAPVFVETARYWLDRLYAEPNDSLSLKGVMGPDEYICLCDNNAYTNSMVRFALEKTLEVMRRADMREEALETRISQAVQRLRCPADEAGIIPQCDGFEQYQEPEFDRFWPDRGKHYGAVVSQERNYRTKALKQADVLMLPYLFPTAFSEDQVAENLDYYMPYTTHDSSLSAVVHAIVLCRLGRVQEAYGFFLRAMNIDLDSERGGAGEGIHIANCGGLWQCVALGFAGMSLAYEENGPSFSPRLPSHWKRLSFRVYYQGRAVDVEITSKGTAISEGNDDARK